MARKPRYTVAKVGLALRESAGVYTIAAKMLDCAPNTIKNYVERSARLQKMMEEVTETNLDIAEAGLLHHLGEKNLSAITFYLRTKGRARGYGDKVELAGKVRTATIDLSAATIEEVRAWAEWDEDPDASKTS